MSSKLAVIYFYTLNKNLKIYSVELILLVVVFYPQIIEGSLRLHHVLLTTHTTLIFLHLAFWGFFVYWKMYWFHLCHFFTVSHWNFTHPVCPADSCEPECGDSVVMETFSFYFLHFPPTLIAEICLFRVLNFQWSYKKIQSHMRGTWSLSIWIKLCNTWLNLTDISAEL